MAVPVPLGRKSERRTRDAEHLAAAICSISASLDLTITLEKVAEQTAQLFQLECAAVCLFDEHGAIAHRHVWSQPQHLLAESRRAIEALIFQKDTLMLLYEYGEPVLIDAGAFATGVNASYAVRR